MSKRKNRKARSRKVGRPRQRKTKSQEPQVQQVSPEELGAIIARAEARGVNTADIDTLQGVIDTLSYVTEELAQKSITLARLRALFGLSSSEKKKDLFGAEPSAEAAAADASDESEAATSASDEGAPPGSSDDARDQAPVDADPPADAKKKAKGHGRNGAAAYTGAERTDVPHESLGSGDPCPVDCRGKVYRRADRPRLIVRVTAKPPLHATVYSCEVYRCNLCGTEFSARPPDGREEKYDERAAAMIALLRYGHGMPFHRLARLQQSLGIPLPASTQWDIVDEAAELLRPAYDALIRQAAQGELQHNDDTNMPVLELKKENEKRLKEYEDAGGTGKRPRVGMFTTAIVSMVAGLSNIVLFFTGRRHAGENLGAVLAQRAAELGPPLQMTDGLDGRNVPKGVEILVANCLVHGRRKFVQLAETFPPACRHVIETLGEVYMHDATTRETSLSDADRLAYHQTHSKPLMDGLRVWMEQQFAEKIVEPNGALGKAISYMLKRWEKLTVFLREPGAPLDNNIAERGLKRAIIHRNNSLFYKTVNGAQVGDLFMSLIHTTEQAGGNPFEYLVALLERHQLVAAAPEHWLPWNYAATLEATTARD